MRTASWVLVILGSVIGGLLFVSGLAGAQALRNKLLRLEWDWHSQFCPTALRESSRLSL